MLIFLSMAAAAVPMILYLILIWRFDRYDREPFLLVLVNFFWGAIGAIILTLLIGSAANFLLNAVILEDNLSDIVQTSISAPIVEEITKGFFLILMIQNRKFDNITDGIVYGGAIGLGFGMTENFMYFVSNTGSIQTWIFVVIIRTLFSAVMHCTSTGTLGAFLGFSKFKSRKWKYIFAFIGLSTSIIIHSAWNSFISFNSTAWIGIIFMILTISIFIIVFNLSIWGERKIIFSELIEESRDNLLPAEHVSILNSADRNKPGWISEGIRKQYVLTSIQLAFRKREYKISTGMNKNYYGAEVDNLRQQIAILLGKS